MKRIRYSIILLVAMLLTVLIQTVIMGHTVLAADYNGHWAQPQMEQLMDLGVIKPDGDGNIYPERPLKRAEMAAIINRAYAYSDKADISGFTDVAPTDWFAEDIAIAVGSGVLSGYEDATMRPNAAISRQEAAVILSRVSGIAEDEGYAYHLSDAMQIGGWARGAVGSAVKSNFITGYPDGTFRPQATIKRAEAFAMIQKMLRSGKPTQPQSVVQEKEPGHIEVGPQETYGNNSSVTLVEELIINGADAVVKNVCVNGDLIIQDISSGQVTLSGVLVGGTVYVNGSVHNTIAIENTSIQKTNLADMLIRNGIGTIKVHAGDIAMIRFESEGKLTVSSSADVQEVRIHTKDSIALSGPIQLVVLEHSGSKVDMSGATVNRLDITSDALNSTINTSVTTAIDWAVIDSAAKFYGKGTIALAQINVRRVFFDVLPEYQSGDFFGSLHKDE